MTDKPFLSDVQELRRRARQHIDEGAVTEGYRGNRDTIPDQEGAARNPIAGEHKPQPEDKTDNARSLGGGKKRGLERQHSGAIAGRPFGKKDEGIAARQSRHQFVARNSRAVPPFAGRAR